MGKNVTGLHKIRIAVISRTPTITRSSFSFLAPRAVHCLKLVRTSIATRMWIISALLPVVSATLVPKRLSNYMVHICIDILNFDQRLSLFTSTLDAWLTGLISWKVLAGRGQTFDTFRTAILSIEGKHIYDCLNWLFNRVRIASKINGFWMEAILLGRPTAVPDPRL